MRTLKPVRGAFLFGRMQVAVLVLAMATIGLSIGAMVQPLFGLLIPIAWVGVLGVRLGAAHVAYTKERYEIHEDHLVCHRGGLFSDGRSELDLRNVTHVRLRLPWLRYRLFGIGDLRVESAGSAGSEITFSSVVEAEALYEELQELLQKNGFSLDRKERLFEASPTAVGALLEAVRSRAIPVFWTALFVGGMPIGILADEMDGFVPYAAPLLGVVGLSAVGLSVALGAILYMDMRRRVYTVYGDAVVYTEGFLTRDNAVIPYENIADAGVTRTFVDQVLGLYDVKVSCQGSGSEITFLKLGEGDALQEAIRSLVKEGRQPKPVVAKKEEGEESPAQPSGRPVSERPVVDEPFTATLTMNVTRAVAPMLLLLVFPPVGIFAVIGVLVQALRTTYTVTETSIGRRFAFINVSEEEFAYDKVTGVQVTRSPFDRFFHTVSVEVWSIGASKPLLLAHLSESAVDLPALLLQCGIPDSSAPEHVLEQEMTPQNWLFQNIPGHLFVVGLGLCGIFLGPFVVLWILGGGFLYLLAILYDIALLRHQQLALHSDHLLLRSGVLVKTENYVRYDCVKKVESIRIPTTNEGTLKLYVAGERYLQQQQGKQQQGMLIPYTVSARYLTGIRDKVDALDALLLGKIEAAEAGGSHAQDEDVLMETKPAVANGVAPLLLFPPFWLFVPLVFWMIRVRSYAVETDRIVQRTGVYFRTKTSVLFDRIDSLQQHQGMLGKIFGNGQVTLLTAGSSKPDLTIRDVADYEEVYSAVRKNYGGGGASVPNP